jgi:hypothetical protein
MTTVSTTISSVMAVADTVDGRNIGTDISVAVTTTTVPMTTIPIASIRGLCRSLPLVESVSSVAVTVSGVGTACDSKMVRTGCHHSGGVTGSDGAVVVGNETVSAGRVGIGKGVSMDTVATNGRVRVLGISFPLVKSVSSVAVTLRSVGVALGVEVAGTGRLDRGGITGSHGAVIVLHEAVCAGGVDISLGAVVPVAVAAIPAVSEAMNATRVSVLGRGGGNNGGKNELKCKNNKVASPSVDVLQAHHQLHVAFGYVFADQSNETGGDYAATLSLYTVNAKPLCLPAGRADL